MWPSALLKGDLIGMGRLINEVGVSKGSCTDTSEGYITLGCAVYCIGLLFISFKI